MAGVAERMGARVVTWRCAMRQPRFISTVIGRHRHFALRLGRCRSVLERGAFARSVDRRHRGPDRRGAARSAGPARRRGSGAVDAGMASTTPSDPRASTDASRHQAFAVYLVRMPTSCTPPSSCLTSTPSSTEGRQEPATCRSARSSRISVEPRSGESRPTRHRSKQRVDGVRHHGALQTIDAAQPFGPAPTEIVSADGLFYVRWEFYQEPDGQLVRRANAWPFLKAASFPTTPP